MGFFGKLGHGLKSFGKGILKTGGKLESSVWNTTKKVTSTLHKDAVGIASGLGGLANNVVNSGTTIATASIKGVTDTISGSFKAFTSPSGFLVAAGGLLGVGYLVTR